jgi:DNA-binding XRE family transcriptional regulator
MICTPKDVPDTPPSAQQTETDRRSEELVIEIESLKELRRISGMSQIKMAEALKISQPTVSRIDNQTGMYLSLLRRYVEALDGKLDVIVRLPNRGSLKVGWLEDVIPFRLTACPNDGPASDDALDKK